MSIAETEQNKSVLSFNNKSYFSHILVTSDPYMNSKETSVTFSGKLISYTDKGKFFYPENKSINIQMYSSYIGALKLNTGDTIECYCSFSTPQKSDEYGDFDYNLYLRQKEIPIMGFCKFLRLSDKSYNFSFGNKFTILGSRLRRSICDTLDIYFGYSLEHSALAKSILTGDKTDIPQTLRDAMAKSGTSHIAAVSGMHVSVLFSAISILLGIIQLRRKWILAFTVPFLVLFMSVASFSPSVMRAVLMLIVYITAYLMERDHDAITALFISAFVILIINPYTLFSASFLLSFGSSLSILIFTPLLKSEFCRISAIPLIGGFIADSFSVTIASFLGTAYFSLYFFNYIVLSGLAVNLWVIPLVPIIFCCGYIIWITNFIIPEFIVRILSYPITFSIEIIVQTAYYFEKVPLLYPYLKLPSQFQFIVYLSFLVFLYFLLSYRRELREQS